MIASTEKLLTPHGIARLFGGSSTTFTLSANGITVCKDNGETFTVLVESFLQDVRLSKGLFLCKLTLKTDQGDKVFNGLRKDDANALFVWLRDYWYQQLALVISEQAQAIKKILAMGYLRSSRWANVQNLAQQALERFGNIPRKACVGRVDHQDFVLVHQVANWQTQDVEAFRERLVKQNCG